MENNFFIVFIVSIYLNASHYDILNFRLLYFHVLNTTLFLHSTLVLLFYIYVILRIFIWTSQGNEFYPENLDLTWPGAFCDIRTFWMKLTGLSHYSNFPKWPCSQYWKPTFVWADPVNRQRSAITLLGTLLMIDIKQISFHSYTLLCLHV